MLISAFCAAAALLATSAQACPATGTLTNFTTVCAATSNVFPRGLTPRKLPVGTTELPASQRGQLLTLVRIALDDCDTPIAVARSYEGNAWEAAPYVLNAAHPTVQPDCTPRGCSGCTFTLTGDEAGLYSYRIDLLDVTTAAGLALAPARTAKTATVRLMLQGTFGPTRAELAAFETAFALTGDGEAIDGITTAQAAAWLQTQIELPATELRTYFRQRTNPRSPASTPMGALIRPCDPLSRWHRLALTNRDRGLIAAVVPDHAAGAFRLSIDGVLRTEGLAEDPFYGDSYTSDSVNRTYAVRRVTEKVGGQVRFVDASGQRLCGIARTPQSSCGKNAPEVYGQNPAISFADGAAADDDVVAAAQVFDSDTITLTRVHADSSDAVLLASTTVGCIVDPDLAASAVIYMTVVNAIDSSRTTYRYDPRLRFIANTLDQPANTSSPDAGTCPSAPRTDFNKGFCVRQRASEGAAAPCSTAAFESTQFELNLANIRAWYTTSGRFVYVMRGLRLDEDSEFSRKDFRHSVCQDGYRSRWRKTAGQCTDGVTTFADPDTRATIAAALIAAASTDLNPIYRDVVVSNQGSTCNTEDLATKGSRIEAEGTCFANIHPHEGAVVDATHWSAIHDGNENAAKNGHPNPITRFAIAGGIHLDFPPWHSMSSQWDNREHNLVDLGRLGDTINFVSVPTTLQTIAMAAFIGASLTGSSQLGQEQAHVGVLVCGAPGESINDPTLGHRYISPTEKGDIYTSDVYGPELKSPYKIEHGKHNLMFNAVLKAQDQLRQRTAWALSQIIVMASPGLKPNGDDMIESWATFYDIFTRNAFGNYRDILREVSSNAMMAQYLTFFQNRGYPSSQAFPDENYAREIMQLFTIGLWKLNLDGTRQLDGDGNHMETYTNDDVMTFSRIWTGYDSQQPRGNLQADYLNGVNYMDPMQVKPEWRDEYPKTALGSGYIGDGFPLCTDLPPQPYLAKGARFVYTGTVSGEGASFDSNNATGGRFRPAAGTSTLHAALCAAEDGSCTFPSEVILAVAIPCDGAQECNAEYVRVVEMVDSSATPTPLTVYYTFVAPPCVQLAFFDDGMLTTAKQVQDLQCASASSTTAASPTCCDVTGLIPLGTAEDGKCLFAAESMSFSEAAARCVATYGADTTVCTMTANMGSGAGNAVKSQGLVREHGCASGVYHWSSTPCSLMVQVHRNGAINVVQHDSGLFHPRFARHSGNTFDVRWEDNTFPSVSGDVNDVNCSTIAGCEVDVGGTCVCDISVETGAVFTDMASIPVTAAGLRSRLFIGAHADAYFGTGTYAPCTTSECTDDRTGITIYLGDSGTLGIDTIFELTDGAESVFLQNIESVVRIGSVGTVQYTLRNPPQFMPRTGEFPPANSWTPNPRFAGQSAEAANNERDALIDHLFHHQNVAPFIAYRVIHRMVTSNPSPRYVEAVATAFRDGVYTSLTDSNSGVFGDGRYGSLAATVAAVFLDREARSSILDADPTAGKLTEPLLKVLHLMRSMEYVPTDDNEIAIDELGRLIGQNFFMSETVFNFYDVEYQPSGQIGQSGLVSPESQLSTAPLTVRWFNGISSLINNGLSYCDDGWGDRTLYALSPHKNCLGGANSAIRNRYHWRKNNDGELTFVPEGTSAAAVVDELALYLTAGRLGNNARSVALDAYETAAAATNATEAVRAALKTIMLTSEFHTSALAPAMAAERPVSQTLPSTDGSFKAVVVVFLAGGADSFNALIPHSGCGAGRDLYEEYKTVRGGAAQDKPDLLPIDATGFPETPHQQPCATFALHPALQNISQLYGDGDAVMFANMGALVEPVSLEEFKAKTKRVPVNLFAHNTMTDAAGQVHAGYSAASGVLARYADALSSGTAPKKTALFSLTGNQRILAGSDTVIPNIVSARGGIARFVEYAEMEHTISNLTKHRSSSLMADFVAGNLVQAFRSTEELGGMLASTTVGTTFRGESRAAGDKSLAMQLKEVAKIIKLGNDADALGLDRAAFMTKIGGWDTHHDEKRTVDQKLAIVDEAIGDFVAEMKAQSLFDNVTLIVMSEFGRTITSNGRGTDHAWGGNYFAVGGSLRGGQVLGSYPDVLDADHVNNSVVLKRGRVIPTTPWEGLHNAVASWFGVEDNQLAEVLPNKANFPPDRIFEEYQMYTTASAPPVSSAPVTAAPTAVPTASPSSSSPTPVPSAVPTTTSPTVADQTFAPTVAPHSSAPTANPASSAPTAAPASSAPTTVPTENPTSPAPTAAPASSAPTRAPTVGRPVIAFDMQYPKRCAAMADSGVALTSAALAWVTQHSPIDSADVLRVEIACNGGGLRRRSDESTINVQVVLTDEMSTADAAGAVNALAAATTADDLPEVEIDGVTVPLAVENVEQTVQVHTAAPTAGQGSGTSTASPSRPRVTPTSAPTSGAEPEAASDDLFSTPMALAGTVGVVILLILIGVSLLVRRSRGGDGGGSSKPSKSQRRNSSVKLEHGRRRSSAYRRVGNDPDAEPLAPANVRWDTPRADPAKYEWGDASGDHEA